MGKNKPAPYIVARGGRLSELQDVVINRMEAGYVPQGGLVHTPPGHFSAHKYLQAMVYSGIKIDKE
jgi:hypothetical protein